MNKVLRSITADCRTPAELSAWAEIYDACLDNCESVAIIGGNGKAAIIKAEALIQRLTEIEAAAIRVGVLFDALDRRPIDSTDDDFESWVNAVADLTEITKKLVPSAFPLRRS